MAEYVEVGAEIQLLYDTVVNLNDLAENSYTQAKATLDNLANAAQELPLTVVDTDIGASITLTWTGSITPITPSAAPTFLDDYLLTLPTEAPTVPDVTVTLTELTAEPPTIDPLETPDAPDGIGTLTFDALPSVGTLPTIAPTMPTMGELPTIDDTLPTLGTLPTIAPTLPTMGELPTIDDTLPTLAALPTIDTVIPVIDVSVLEAAFDYTEPEYVPELKSQMKAELLRVLGGDLGLPAWHWNAIWNQAAGDLAKQQVGRLRNARNRGAASYWPLPGETVLAASKAIADEGARSLQVTRLQQATQAAVMAREDFWHAVERGIQFEAQWIDLHEKLAARSLAAAEVLVNLQIGVHNSNVQRFNLVLEAAKTEVEIDKITIDALLRAYEGQLQGVKIGAEVGNTITDAVIRSYEGGLKGAQIEAEVGKITTDALLRAYEGQLQGVKIGAEVGNTITDAVIRTYEGGLKGAQTEAEVGKILVDAVLREYEGKLRGSAMNIEQVKARIDKYQAEWGAKNTRERTLVETFGESVRAWSSQIDAEIKAGRFPLDKAEIEARVHGTLFGAVGALAEATTALVNADVQNNRMVLDGEIAEIDHEKAKNLANIEVGKITQAAQEAQARIDVAQAQWIAGQAQDLQKRIAELSYGYAQAAVAASDVSYGRSINASNSYGETASHNAEKVW